MNKSQITYLSKHIFRKAGYFTSRLRKLGINAEYDEVVSELGLAYSKARKGYDGKVEHRAQFGTYLSTCYENAMKSLAGRLTGEPKTEELNGDGPEFTPDCAFTYMCMAEAVRSLNHRERLILAEAMGVSERVRMRMTECGPDNKYNSLVRAIAHEYGMTRHFVRKTMNKIQKIVGEWQCQ
jgi:hypothetical protein